MTAKTLVSIEDEAFGPFHQHLQHVQRRLEPAYREAAWDTAHRLAHHANEAMEQEGLGRPVLVWGHQGHLLVGVPQSHPDANEIGDHEYGTVSSAPHATLRRTFWQSHHVATAHFLQRFQAGVVRGSRWGR